MTELKSDVVISDKMSPNSLCIPNTTTISTIALQSGTTRLIIAILQSGQFMSLRILEMKPKMAHLERNVQDSEEILKYHEQVLEKIRSKQNPVEELLSQADKLVDNKNPEVYIAMADSLGRAWRDVNLTLDLRREILLKALEFHKQRMTCLEYFNKVFLNKKEALVTYRYAVEDGRRLINLLHLSAKDNEEEAAYSISLVNIWLDELHHSQLKWQQELKKAKLKQKQTFLKKFYDDELAKIESEVSSGANLDDIRNRLLKLCSSIDKSELNETNKTNLQRIIFNLIERITINLEVYDEIESFIKRTVVLDEPAFGVKYDEKLNILKSFGLIKSENLEEKLKSRIKIRKFYESVLENPLDYDDSTIEKILNEDKDLEITSALNKIKEAKNDMEKFLYDFLKEKLDDLGTEAESLDFDNIDINALTENLRQIDDSINGANFKTIDTKDLLKSSKDLEMKLKNSGDGLKYLKSNNLLHAENFKHKHEKFLNKTSEKPLLTSIKNKAATRIEIRKNFDKILENPKEYALSFIEEVLTKDETLDTEMARHMISQRLKEYENKILAEKEAMNRIKVEEELIRQAEFEHDQLKNAEIEYHKKLAEEYQRKSLELELEKENETKTLKELAAQQVRQLEIEKAVEIQKNAQIKIELEKQRVLNEELEIKRLKEIEREREKQLEIELEKEQQLKMALLEKNRIENQLESQIKLNEELQREKEIKKELERQREIEAELRRQLEIEAKLNKQREIDLEINRQIQLRELELNRQREIEEELKKQRDIDLEIKKQIGLRELELNRQREIEAELNKQREINLEINKQIQLRELELGRQREIEEELKRQREIELEQQKLEKMAKEKREREVEIERQRQIQEEEEKNREEKQREEEELIETQRLLLEQQKLEDLFELLDFPLPENLKTAQNDLADFQKFESLIQEIENPPPQLIEKMLNKKEQIEKCLEFYQLLQRPENIEIEKLRLMEWEIFQKTTITEEIIRKYSEHIYNEPEPYEHFQESDSEVKSIFENSTVETQTAERDIRFLENSETQTEDNTKNEPDAKIDPNPIVILMHEPAKVLSTNTTQTHVDDNILASTHVQTDNNFNESQKEKEIGSEMETQTEDYANSDSIQMFYHEIVEESQEDYEKVTVDEKIWNVPTTPIMNYLEHSKTNEKNDMDTQTHEDIAKLIKNSSCQTLFTGGIGQNFEEKLQATNSQKEVKVEADSERRPSVKDRVLNLNEKIKQEQDEINLHHSPIFTQTFETQKHVYNINSKIFNESEQSFDNKNSFVKTSHFKPEMSPKSPSPRTVPIQVEFPKVSKVEIYKSMFDKFSKSEMVKDNEQIRPASASLVPEFKISESQQHSSKYYSESKNYEENYNTNFTSHHGLNYDEMRADSSLSDSSSINANVGVWKRPSKFIPVKFTESDYESDAESFKIEPIWIPPSFKTRPQSAVDFSTKTREGIQANSEKMEPVRPKSTVFETRKPVPPPKPASLARPIAIRKPIPPPKPQKLNKSTEEKILKNTEPISSTGVKETKISSKTTKTEECKFYLRPLQSPDLYDEDLIVRKSPVYFVSSTSSPISYLTPSKYNEENQNFERKETYSEEATWESYDSSKPEPSEFKRFTRKVESTSKINPTEKYTYFPRFENKCFEKSSKSSDFGGDKFNLRPKSAEFSDIKIKTPEGYEDARNIRSQSESKNPPKQTIHDIKFQK